MRQGRGQTAERGGGTEHKLPITKTITRRHTLRLPHCPARYTESRYNPLAILCPSLLTSLGRGCRGGASPAIRVGGFVQILERPNNLRWAALA